MKNAIRNETRHRVARVVLSAFTALPASVFAFQPLITDDAGTQGSGGNQLEFSFSRDRAKNADETVRVQTLPVTYTRGLSETLDVFVGMGYSRIRSSAPGFDSSGSGNPSLGAKWRFYENEESRTTLAIKPEVLLPVSASRENTGLGTGKISGNLTFILSQEMPFGAIHFNAGVGRERYRDSEANPDTRLRRFSLAPVWDVTEQWKLALDLGVESARASGSQVRTRFVELGAIYSPGKDLDIALGLVRAADNDTSRTTTHTATAGITWRF